MANTYLQKQTVLAKKIRKANPKLSWIEAVKKAAAEIKSSKTKVGAIKKKAATKKAVKKTVPFVTVKRTIVQQPKKVSGVNASNELFNTSNKLMEYERDILEAKQKLKIEKTIAEKNKIKQYIKNRNNQYIALKKYLNTLARFR
jgi:hypothetical protein